MKYQQELTEIIFKTKLLCADLCFLTGERYLNDVVMRLNKLNSSKGPQDFRKYLKKFIEVAERAGYQVVLKDTYDYGFIKGEETID